MIGPRGKTQKELEQRTGAKIVFRGRGSSKDGLPTGHPDDDEDLHVSVEGPSDSVEKAVLELEDILHNPQRAEQLKQQQLRNLSEINNSGGIYGPGNSGGMTIGTAGETILELPVPNHLVGPLCFLILLFCCHSYLDYLLTFCFIRLYHWSRR